MFVVRLEITITCLHLAASEFFNAINFVTVALVEAGHVIAVLFAVTPSLIVKRQPHTFIVTVFIKVGVTLWVATFGFVNVLQEIRSSFAQSEAVHVITFWTQRPDMISGKKGEINRQLKKPFNNH